MTTPEERDFIGEVIAEDVATRCQPFLTLAESLRQYRHNNAEGFVSAYEYDGTRKAFNELRQQLADVSHERDLLRAQLSAPTPEQMLDIGENYWKSRQKSSLDAGAVKWVKDPETGALLIYTRGEYVDVLMDAVMSIEAPTSAEVKS